MRAASQKGAFRTPAATGVDTGAGRPLALLAVMVLAAGALVSRLVFWQVMQHGHLSAVAAAQRADLVTQPPLRGQITDANGNVLASDITLDEVYAVPKEMRDPVSVAHALAPVLGITQAHLQKVFSLYTGYVLLAPQVPTGTSDRIKSLGLQGIVLHPVIRRYYPEAAEAGQIVGFVRNDSGRGQSGVEAYYDNLLSGQAGLGSVLKDTAGNEIRVSNAPVSPAHNGANLQLTIDGVVQSLAEHELKKAVTAHSADSGTIIVMDPNTGYILGMASTPSFNPNRYWLQMGSERNPAVEWTYEPGSTFKIVTMAAGLDSHIITPETAFDDTGVFQIGDATIHNWNDGGFGWETMTQVLQHSANVGASWVAEHLTTRGFYSYVRRFGLGSPTGADLADEQSGILPLPGQKDWTIVSKYTNSYGQGVSVTPLQLMRAVAAVANGGRLMKPQIVKQITYDGRIITHDPVVQGHPISPQTAQTLTSMLVQSAIGGEAKQGLVSGYDIAAKTGTASIAGPDGHYIQGATIASIVGYAPATHPKIAALIIINHPRDTPWGSEAAAPVLHNLFQELFLYYHIPPSPHALNQ